MGNLRLSGPEMRVLRDLLREAFARPRFEEFLLYRLDKRPEDFTSANDDYPTALRKILVEANASLWWRDLLREARNAVPGDGGLQGFGEQFGVSPVTVAPAVGGMAVVQGPQLQLKIKEAQSTFDIVKWRKRLGEIEAQVCRIEIPEGTAKGTGFLIGPNAVLTNYHVIEKVHQGSIGPASIALRFDYKVSGDGIAVQAGTVYRLHADWLADFSMYSSLDLEVNPAGEPGLEELDYAVLRVQGTPGTDPVGGETNDPNPAPRNWIEAPAAAHDFAAQRSLYIVQHPDGKPMQIALDTEAVLAVNGKGTRLRYTTTTEPGSSGSPCFGPDWQWVAVHHSGDPKYTPWNGVKPTYNEGIPLTAIRSLLTERGKAAVLGGGVI
jgi:V8-like Glu-specific endopeptidase